MARMKCRCAVFEIRTRGKYGGIDRSRIEAAGGKERQALLDGADAERLDPLDPVPLPEDELGRTAADIEHQAPLFAAWQRAGHAHIDQPPFFFAGNDFDRKANSFFR